MDQQRFKELVSKYANGQCTPEEERLLETWYNRLSNEQPDTLPEPDYANIGEELMDAIVQQRLPNPEGTIRRFPRKYVAFAAAAVLLFAVGITLYLSPALFNNDASTSIAKFDKLPASNKATLTLADGRTIDLSEAQTGIVVGDGITYQDGSLVVDGRPKTGDGRPGNGTPESQLLSSDFGLLTLTTPKGGTYQITLPDGSKVWLNAGSTLKYPARFAGTTRTVEIEGEAFFEVKPNKAVPFIVKSAGQEVNVLGTSFNVAAYADDPVVKTTLVEGSVLLKAAATGASVSLVPGEQGVLTDKGLAKQQVDLEIFTAWKDGYFKFDHTLEEVMAQIARWYDVDVVYEEGASHQLEIYAQLSRTQKLSDVLHYLEEADKRVKLQLTEGRVTVMK